MKSAKSVYCSIQKCYYLVMKVYHGSKSVIKSPTPNGSKNDNDYGPAFYLTRDLESAHEWACRNRIIGFVNEYDLNIKGLNVLDLSDKSKYSVLNWLAILLHFRTLDPNFITLFKTRLQFLEDNYYIDINDYDLVIGYRADDAYFRFPLEFVRGNITIEQLEYAFNLGNLGIQYVITSQKGIEQLKFIKSIRSSGEYLNRYFNNVISATKSFDSLNRDEDGIRIFDIMRNNK